MTRVRRILPGVFMTLGAVALLATTVSAQMPQTTTSKTPGTATVTTEQMSGEVVKVEGNTVVVKMASGELRTFSNVPDSRRAMIDGKEVGVRDLKPGTKLTATITRTETPITVRTTTVGTGKVWFVSGTSVILTLPSGENKQYNVKPDYKFIVNGQPATVYDLRPGMTVSAEKIVEEPKLDIVTDRRVVGQAPAPAPAAAPAQTPAPAPAPAPAAASGARGGSSASRSPSASAPVKKLPKTASPLPLVGLLGLLLVGGSAVIRRVRRS